MTPLVGLKLTAMHEQRLTFYKYFSRALMGSAAYSQV